MEDRKRFPRHYLDRFCRPKDEKIIETFLELSEGCTTETQFDACAALTTERLNASRPLVDQVLIKAKLRDKAKEIGEEVKRDILLGKVPLLKEITDLSLTSLRDFLHHLSGDEVRKKDLSIKEAESLARIATSINEFLRLEEGRSTENKEVHVRMTHEKTVEVLSELKKIDPVFEYPEVNGTGTKSS